MAVRACSLLCVFPLLASGAPQNGPANIADADKPSQQISLTAFGYKGLSPLSRFTTQNDLTINFLDNDHVLFTYNPKKIVARRPECPASHKDHSIQAGVLDLASGKLIREASWYMHDEHRYLWPLGQGHFLLRILNSLYELDSNLQQKLLIELPQQILWTSITPDGKQIIVETAIDSRASKKDQPRNKAKVKIDFLNVQTLAVQRTIRLSGVVPLNGTSLGFGDALRGMSGKVWLVRFGSSARERDNVTRVRSQCVPNLLFPTNNTILVGRCSASGSDYSVSVFTVTGHFLWRQRWNQHRYEPAIERSEDASRVAISSIAGTLPGLDNNPTANDEEHWPEVEQKIQVVNAATGTPVVSTKARQAILSGQDFSLAPDGSRLAVVDGTMLRIYELAPMPADERAKYLAMQADAPTLTAPSAAADKAEAANDEVFDVASQSSADQLQPAPVAAQPPATAPASAATPVPAGPDGKSVAQGQVQAAVEQTQRSDPAITTFRVSAKTVVVDVVVTDSKGHTVKGLPKENFQIQEDGKAQKVNYFHEYTGYTGNSDSTNGSQASAAATPKLPPNVFANNQLAREDVPVTVFLLDLLNTPPEAQYFAKEQLIRFLKDKPTGAQFALCTLTNSLRLIQGFTNDEATLITTANGRKGAVRYAPLHERNGGLDTGMQMQKDVAAFDSSKQFVVQMFQQAQAEERAQELDRRVWITVDGFAQLARYLSGIPGRKNVVWLSASFPLGIFPNNDLFNAFSETRTYAELMKKTANLLADSHVAVYPVDVRGLMTQSVFAASSIMNPTAPAPGSFAPAPAGANNSALQNTAQNAQSPNPLAQATHEDLEQQVGDQSTMDQIASDTGGKAFYNTNGIKEAIQTAVEQGSEYYMLSYTPANHNYDGKLRKIKVALSAKGYHLAYRHGYFADDPFAPLKQEKDALSRDVGNAAMQHGSPQSHQILFASRVVPVGKPTKVDPAKQNLTQIKKKKKQPLISEVQHYAVDYAIAGSQLHFSDEGEMHHGVLDFMASSFDDDGKALSRIASRTVADLKASSYQDTMIGGFRVHQEFDVPTDAASLRLGVEDELNRKLGTVEISLPVPPAPDEPNIAKARSLPEIEPD